MCDSVAAVRSETAAGTTLFAKNSDRKPGEVQPFLLFPAAHHPPRARLRCTHVEIPQVAETYRVMGHSPSWVWGFEHGVNEHAVAIGNHTIFSNEPLEAEPGLIGMDLVRLGLERGRDAREALEIVAALLETHGQGGPALAPDGAGYHNSFLIADPESAWILETSNRRWAARRASLAACSNHYALKADWEIASRDLEPFARASGWWQGTDRIDVTAAFRNPHVPAQISEGRHRRTRAWLSEARGGHDVASFQRLLRDHGAGATVWTGQTATSDEEAFFTVCAHSAPVHETTASFVVELPADRSAPWPAWISYATPCSSIFLPVYLDGVLPDRHACADARGAWQTFARLQRAVSPDPVRHTPRVRARFVSLEARIEQERRAVERAAAAEEREPAAELVTEFMRRSLDAALAEADAIAESLR
ncbi:MAG TPA: C69 family dipeptidase [Myxococcota bacterium]|nr:C69 family dipeptidase [Myxococcota bacterium]